MRGATSGANGWRVDSGAPDGEVAAICQVSTTCGTKMCASQGWVAVMPKIWLQPTSTSKPAPAAHRMDGDPGTPRTAPQSLHCAAASTADDDPHTLRRGGI